jgi:hypothetical protein
MFALPQLSHGQRPALVAGTPLPLLAKPIRQNVYDARWRRVGDPWGSYFRCLLPPGLLYVV